MKNKTIKKIILTIIVIFGIFSVLTPVTHAGTISDIFSGADDFLNAGQTDSTLDSDKWQNSLEEMSNLLYNTLLIIGIVIAVIIGMVIGIKFMTGSVEEKAKVKETLIPYIAGCVVVFGAFTIWKIIVTIMQDLPSI